MTEDFIIHCTVEHPPIPGGPIWTATFGELDPENFGQDRGHGRTAEEAVQELFDMTDGGRDDRADR